MLRWWERDERGRMYIRERWKGKQEEVQEMEEEVVERGGKKERKESGGIVGEKNVGKGWKQRREYVRGISEKKGGKVRERWRKRRKNERDR